jgi:SAM-dependent methyltransferase
VRILLFGDSDPTEAPFDHEHLGIASPEELSWAYSESTVGLCLSMTNYSLIPQEMLACGLPCIDLAGFSGEAVFGSDGPVELAPFDPVALADAVERLLDDETLWEQRSRAGREFVADRTWDRAAEQVESGLREALRRRELGGEEERAAGTPAGAGALAQTLVARTVGVRATTSHPATDRLYAKLDPADVAAVEAAFTPDQRADYEISTPEYRRELTLLLGAWHRIPAVLEKTGLRPDEPPPEVHAMARGPLAAAGAIFYADTIADELARAGRPLEAMRSGLDFGCSSGRVVRALQAAYPEPDWHGCDPNEPAVAWASEHLPGISFVHSPVEPPLPYDDGAFDLVVAISIWSHFNEHAAVAWLDEMHRIVRPGGALLFTLHALQSIAYNGQESLRSVRQLQEIRDEMYRRGFWFRNEFGATGDWGVKHHEWGTAFTSPEWLLRHALPRWRVGGYGVGLNAGNQDVVVLLRR